jgi:putative DNA primase/helicase
MAGLPNDEHNLAKQEKAIPGRGKRPGRHPPPVVLSGEEFLARDYPPIEPVIEPWLTTGGLAVVAGDREVGKTFFALSMAYAIAHGRDFLGFTVPRPRKVLYADGDMDPLELQQRLRAIRRAAERDGNGKPDLSANNLRLLTHADQEQGIPDLTDPHGPGRDCLTEALGDSEVLVLDHLTVLGPKRNAGSLGNWDVLQWLLDFRRRNKVVLIVLDADETNWPVLDTVIRLWRSKSGRLVNVDFAKARSCIRPKPFAARMQFEDGCFRLIREEVASS